MKIVSKKTAAITLLSLALPCCLLAAPPRTTVITNAIELIGAQDPAAMKVPVVSGPEIWKDPSKPVDARVQDLISRMSLAEKTSQLMADAPALPRLGIPGYSYRNECLHGVADTGTATVFPQAIGMAATWDPALIHDEADTIATEGRAIFNDYRSQHNGNSIIHKCISFYSPNINIFRDPRWGRGQETYGEDPFLTSQFAVSFIQGLQGDNPKYVKALACAKHYAVHSGPEEGRTHFNSTPPERDLYDTYLRAFEAAVREGHVGSVMGSYNALNGVPNCANPFLLKQVLRDQWGFQGYVVSDGGAIANIWRWHKYVPTAEEAAAVAVKGGCDLYSANFADGNYPHRDFVDLGIMLQKGLLSESEIDQAISYTLASRFHLGLFDPPALVPWSKIGMDQNDTPSHQALALKVAEESIVLLKNNGLLPLDRAKIKHVAVIGPNADAVNMLYGNYDGKASHPITILDGIKQAVGPGVEVSYAEGCPLALKNDGSNKPAPEMTAQAVEAAKSADVVIYVGGLDSTLERENHAVPYDGFYGGDRTKIEFPSPQEDLLKALYATGKPVVLVNCTGSAIAMPWEAGHLPAIVQAWYPGQGGGRAVAEVLFGDVNPSARLPITFYSSTDDLPPFDDYSMSNRTYRYFDGNPLFAFGHGLSYTKFKYSDGELDSKTVAPDGTVKLSFTVKNVGQRDGDEVAQVYFRQKKSDGSQPKLALCGFARVRVDSDKSATVTVDIPADRFRHWDTAQKKYVIEPGKYQLLIGAASDDIRLRVPVEVAQTKMAFNR